jgi:predicted Zn-dependent protease
MKKSIITICALAMLMSCAKNPVTGKKQVMVVSREQEKSMGISADPQIVAEYGLYNNPTLQSFINTKGKEMGKISHMPELEFNFKILDSPIVNAFAVPGGFVYFTRGIMAHFNNEAEFAGVLGHEIGHITARHSSSQQSKQILAQVGLIAGMVVSETFAQFGDLASQGLGLLFLKFSRDHESESDKLGVTYSTQIGYDSHEMANFFGTLSKLSGEGGRIPEFASTHPDPDNRNANVHKHTDDVHAAKSIGRSNLKINRDSYLKMIDGIIVGEDPKQGYFEGTTFYHPELKFTFSVPEGWQKANSPSQIQMAPKDGKAIMYLQLEEGSTLEQASSNFVSKNKITLEDKVNTEVGTFPAVALYGVQTQQGQNGQQGQSIRIMAYLIKYDNLIYKIVGLTSAADFNTYFNTFQKTMTSFKRLLDPSKINKLPERIKIVTASRNATLAEIMRDNNQAESKLNELSILNGMDANSPIKAGSLVKTIVLGPAN